MSLDLGKLEGVTRRFDELNALLSSGELDGEGFSKLSREHAELAPVVEAIEAYKKLLNDLKEAEEIQESANIESSATEEGADNSEPSDKTVRVWWTSVICCRDNWRWI